MHSTVPQSSPVSLLGVEPGRSWLSLLASSTLGVEQVDTLEVEVVAHQLPRGKSPFRLVIQTFDGQRVHKSRPLGSVQRIVTAAELRRGIRLSLVELGGTSMAEPYVVAWLEASDRLLEMDGRRAQPSQGSLIAMGRATRGVNPVRLVLG
ncbi:MAG: hypothetical protein RMJ98_05685 [Myxococcales bacterium]|nr:hypothetical protein [Polyangiaceae bacterium]MDW8248783.1 hypothetical protein [Myxococcales bacterium]